jgi:hypothetical protein
MSDVVCGVQRRRQSILMHGWPFKRLALPDFWRLINGHTPYYVPYASLLVDKAEGLWFWAEQPTIEEWNGY